MPHCCIAKLRIGHFPHKKSAELQSGSMCTQKCCQIKNHQTSKCCQFVIRQITQTQTETEPEAVRSHNKDKITHQGEGHIKVKETYLCSFQFYVAHTVSKRVVGIRLKCILVTIYSWMVVKPFSDHPDFQMVMKDILLPFTYQQKILCDHPNTETHTETDGDHKHFFTHSEGRSCQFGIFLLHQHPKSVCKVRF